MGDGAAGEVDPGEESAHAPGADPRWAEWWAFDLWRPDGSLGVVVRVGSHPGLGVATYLAGIARPGRPPVLVADDDVPPPRRPSALELRAPGLWADHNREEALVHWSVGLEAFGLALDGDALARLARDPSLPGTALVGERIPVGLDLGWEAIGPARWWEAPDPARWWEAPDPARWWDAAGSARPGSAAGVAPVRGSGGDTGPVRGYDLACRVEGEVLVGDEVLEVDGVGRRGHGWGLGTGPDLGPPGRLELALAWGQGPPVVRRQLTAPVTGSNAGVADQRPGVAGQRAGAPGPGGSGPSPDTSGLRALAVLPLPGAPRVGRPAWWRTLVQVAGAGGRAHVDTGAAAGWLGRPWPPSADPAADGFPSVP